MNEERDPFADRCAFVGPYDMGRCVGVEGHRNGHTFDHQLGKEKITAGLTEQEHALIGMLGLCATSFKKILKDDERRPNDYPWDEAEFVAHIHDLQHAVMARACSRLWPERYRP